jgi:hypothetical protein
MRVGIVGTLGIWMAGAGVALAQAPRPAKAPAPSGVRPAAHTATADEAPPGARVMPTTIPDAEPGPAARTPAPPPPPPAAAKPADYNGTDHGVLPAGACDGCAEPASYFWGKWEYILWWYKNQEDIPLVQSVPAELVGPRNFDFALTTPLITTDSGNRNPYSGVRLTAGMWFDTARDVGVEGTYYWLAQHGDHIHFDSTGTPAIGRPFANPVDNTNSILLISSPPPRAAVGSVDFTADTQLYGAELNFLSRGPSILSNRFDFIYGFHWLRLEDNLFIGSTSYQQNLIPIPTKTTRFDQFDTDNNFYGGQVGGRACYRGDRWALELAMKFGMGAVVQDAYINGFSTLKQPFQPEQATIGGVLAQPTNIGTYSTIKTAFLYELTLNLSYNITRNLGVFAGYNLIYLSSAVRPYNAIQLDVNPNQIPFIAGQSRVLEPPPVYAYNSDFWWAQGASVGLNWSY